MPSLTLPDGARLFHEERGDPSNESIVLVEGMGGDIPGWRRTVAHLSVELHVVAFDLRGNGASSEPDGPLTMETFVLDTIALLDALGIGAAHVYGQSFGGMVAIELAIAHPERVLTLIVAATHAGGPGVVPADRGTVPKDEAWRALYAPGFPEAHPEHVAEDLRIAASQPRHAEGGRRHWEAMQAYDAAGRLASIEAPTLVMHGTEDRIVAPANAEILATGIPGAELRLFEGAGHLYHSERADEADAAVLDFIARRRP